MSGNKKYKNDTSHNGLNEDVKIDICIDYKTRAIHKFLSRFIGLKKAPHSLIDGIILFTEGKINPQKHIDESNLIDLAELEKMNGGKIVEWAEDKGRYPIFLDKNLLQEFDKCWYKQEFRSRSEACRAIMYHQIMVWLEKYNTNAEAAQRDSYIIEGEKKLKELLEKLKQRHKHGLELDVAWIPKPDHHLCGEVIEKTIRIYLEDYKLTEWLLCHEYAEYMIKGKFTAPYINLINIRIKEIEKQLYGEQEKIIDTIADMMYKDITGNQPISVSIFSGTGEHSQTASQT